MTWIYATEVLVIAAAVVGMFWLKREGDRNWARHQRSQVRLRLVLDTAQFIASVARMNDAMAAMGPVMSRAAKELSAMEKAMRGVRATIAARLPTDPEETGR